MLDGGGAITQDTLGWDEGGQKTFLMRTKEGEADYRYFPEPDLPPLEITPEWIERVRARMPELPAQKRARYWRRACARPTRDTLSLDVNLSRFYDEALAEAPAPDAQRLANWLLTEVTGFLAAAEQGIRDTALQPAHLAALVRLIDAGTISGKIAKDLLPDVMAGHESRIAGAGTRPERRHRYRRHRRGHRRRHAGADPTAVDQFRAGNAKAMPTPCSARS